MLLDGNHLLLRDEAVPAAERLCVKGGIGVIGRHVLAHDGGGIFGDIETRAEAVLQAHPRHGLRVNAAPRPVFAFDELLCLGNMALIILYLSLPSDLALIGHRARLVFTATKWLLYFSSHTRTQQSLTQPIGGHFKPGGRVCYIWKKSG